MRRVCERSIRNGGRLANQRGAYAIEFALVFVVFFLVVYGLLTYGLIFTAQQSVALAAEEGARAALRWQGPAGSWQARADEAEAAASYQVGWLADMGGAANLPVTVCGKDPAGNAVQAGAGSCGASVLDVLEPGQMEVVVSYLYGAAPLVPSLLGRLNVATPERLVGRARVCLDIATGDGRNCGLPAGPI